MGARLANPGDRGRFAALMLAHLLEMRKKGSEIQPTLHTLDFYLSIFDRYVSGELEGVVVIDDRGGFSMAGDATLPIDTDFGKQATGWGTYVDPGVRKSGVATAMRSYLLDQLREKGFKTLLAAVQEGDSEALRSLESFGPVLVWHQRAGHLTLQ